MTSQDYGAKGSLPGYNVKAVADYLLQFSSSWPLLKIEATGTATVSGGSSQTIHTHNLGYPPFFILLDRTLGGSTSLLNINASTIRGIGVNSNGLVYDGNSFIGGSFSFRYYIFRLPLHEGFKAPLVVGDNTRHRIDHDYGFKVTKPGASTDSEDLRDYSLHSSTRSLMVDQVDYGKNTGFVSPHYIRQVPLSLGYLPIAFAFARFGSNSIGRNPNLFYMLNSVTAGAGFFAGYDLSASEMVMYADSTSINQSPDFSTVILKDPFAKEEVHRSYP